ncbi:P-loop containing nucleoside triphosphate hydrolase protein [Coniophora puteana RWD-64-598 SS2]|uniref:P-loop containing nucleoside triphosphate hydrolase protein n=1 Tax=Coniophora puteana (strain RWD-64-598) TaxID=741705 RepID=A0A5M3M740_CONPW|nr:P-loop containing nucleoside triphosphate hydrolase protein [Coniophora puteana RWD-64-598 SS2]EIW75059.1 P-loop containing nucleoside triphosphate hydrolase protein [Coniophora puteana RWD-64-598 SS2]
MMTRETKPSLLITEWLMSWLSNQPALRKAQNVSIWTQPPFDLAGIPPHMYMEAGFPGNTRREKDITLQMVPSVAEVYTLWHRGRWLQASRIVDTNTVYTGHAEQILSLRMMTWNRKMLRSLIQEAREAHDIASDNVINVYVFETGRHMYSMPWRRLATRPKRPIQSIILDHGIQKLILEDAKDFLQSKAWYTERGIPFRRGYLLHGVPGSGKTSLIHSIAGELDLNVYLISLSRAGMDDTMLTESIAGLPEQCIALMEDIDVAFHHGVTRDSDSSDSSSSLNSSSPDSQSQTPGAHKDTGNKQTKTIESRVSLSGLLNALDGIGAQEGRILFATTNRYSALDPALCRPGRMDLHVEFHNASRGQAEELFRRFFRPTSGKETSTADSDQVNGDDLDLGASSSEEECETMTDFQPKYYLAKESGMDVSKEPPPAYVGVTHRQRAPHLSPEQLDELAARFAVSIPERKFSMAALQGYLMTYKVRPVQAVENIACWVAKELSNKKQDVIS